MLVKYALFFLLFSFTLSNVTQAETLNAEVFVEWNGDDHKVLIKANQTASSVLNPYSQTTDELPELEEISLSDKLSHLEMVMLVTGIISMPGTTEWYSEEYLFNQEQEHHENRQQPRLTIITVAAYGQESPSGGGHQGTACDDQPMDLSTTSTTFQWRAPVSSQECGGGDDPEEEDSHTLNNNCPACNHGPCKKMHEILTKQYWGYWTWARARAREDEPENALARQRDEQRNPESLCNNHAASATSGSQGVIVIDSSSEPENGSEAEEVSADISAVCTVPVVTEGQSTNGSNRKVIPSLQGNPIEVTLNTRVSSNICEICCKSFSSKGKLKRHSVVHTGEYAYKCDQCDKGFLFQSHLKRHSVVHTGEHAYKCDQCDKGFLFKCHLKRHSVVHTGEHAYKCDQCDKSFNVQCNLKRHIRVSHQPAPTVINQHDRRHLLHNRTLWPQTD